MLPFPTAAVCDPSVFGNPFGLGSFDFVSTQTAGWNLLLFRTYQSSTRGCSLDSVTWFRPSTLSIRMSDNGSAASTSISSEPCPVLFSHDFFSMLSHCISDRELLSLVFEARGVMA